MLTEAVTELAATAAAPQISAVGEWLNTTFASFDYAVFKFFAGLHQTWLSPIIGILTDLGDSVFVIPLLVFALFMCLWRKNRRWAMSLFFAIVLGTLMTNVIIKPLISRPRPYVSLAGDAQFMQWYTEAGALTESDKSFPSGHTTASVEIAVALMLAVKRKWLKPLFLIYPLFIGCSRLYLCVHYCTDVLGGLIIGIIAGVLAYTIARSLMSWMIQSEGGLGKKLDDIDLGRKKNKKKAEAQ